MKNFLTQLINLLFLTLSVLFAFYWSQNPSLSPYSIQVIGLLIILYFVFTLNCRGGVFPPIFGSLIITLVILLVVLTTGGLQSPAIFLIFILATFISLIMSPLTAMAIITLIAFLLQTDQILIWLLIPAIISLISKHYLKLLENQQKIKIIETKEKILETEVKNIETDISTFTNQSLTTLEGLIKRYNLPELKNLYEKIKSLPDKLDEEEGK